MSLKRSLRGRESFLWQLVPIEKSGKNRHIEVFRGKCTHQVQDKKRVKLHFYYYFFLNKYCEHPFFHGILRNGNCSRFDAQ